MHYPDCHYCQDTGGCYRTIKNTEVKI
jgi:hypothetical protein